MYAFQEFIKNSSAPGEFLIVSEYIVHIIVWEVTFIQGKIV